MIKYRLINDDGSWIETTDLSVAQEFGNYIELPIEQIQESVPQNASKMRFFLALLGINITRTMIYNAINQIQDEVLKEIVLIKFDLSQEFDRNDEHLNMMAQMFQISQEQLDQLFREANQNNILN